MKNIPFSEKPAAPVADGAEIAPAKVGRRPGRLELDIRRRIRPRSAVK